MAGEWICPICGELNDPDDVVCVKTAQHDSDEQPAARPIRSRADAITAGRAHARARGDRLTPTQIVRLAALIRPHLDEPRAETA